jgi:cytochrome c oxidase assembly factor CtaG
MSPTAAGALVLAALSVAGAVARASRGSLSGRARRQFLEAMAAAAVLFWATDSAWAERSMTDLTDHMISHILLMFLVPLVLVHSGVSRLWWWALPVGPRRRVLRWWYLRRRVRAPRWLAHPLTAALSLNAVMVSAHVPAIFDFLMDHRWAMDWLMEPAFLLSGLWFFHFLVTSRPRRLRSRLRWQATMVVATMLEMLLVAMALSIFTHHAWYHLSAPAMASMGMTGATSTGFDWHHQQLAAGVLWICGDFWAVPLLAVIVRRVVVREGSLFAVLERPFS